jgi:hypothetical protein
MLDIAGEQRQQPIGIAASWFDFNHVGAKIRPIAASHKMPEYRPARSPEDDRARSS